MTMARGFVAHARPVRRALASAIFKGLKMSRIMTNFAKRLRAPAFAGALLAIAAPAGAQVNPREPDPAV